MVAATIMPKEDCEFQDLAVRISDSAFMHMNRYGINMYTLCDMLQSPVDCPKLKKTGKSFRRGSKRLCSFRKGQLYNIILDCIQYNNEHVWSVSHLEPI